MNPERLLNAPSGSLPAPRGHQKDREDLAPYSPRLDATPPNPAIDEGSVAFAEIWKALRLHRRLLLGFTAAGVALGFLVTSLQTPVYQALVTLEIQGANEAYVYLKDLDPVDRSGVTHLQTQLKLLQSKAVVEPVVARLGLHGIEEFVPRSSRPLWRRGKTVTEPPPPKQVAVASTQQRMHVQQSGQSRLVEMMVESADARLAASIANEIADEFVRQNRQDRFEAFHVTGDLLTMQGAELKAKLTESEKRLQNYARSQGLLFTRDSNSVAEDRLRQLQEDLSKAYSERVARQTQFELASSSPAESLPEILDDPSLREYQAKLIDLRRELAELTANLTPTHYKVQRVQAQVVDLEKSLASERRKRLDRIKNEFDSVKRRERLISSAYERQAAKVSTQAYQTIQYNLLKREVETNREVYEGVLRKVKEAGVASAMGSKTARVVDHAEPPTSPAKPNPFLGPTLGLLGGGFAGLLLIIARMRSDQTLRAPGHASAYLAMPELGAIPAARTGQVTLIAGESNLDSQALERVRTDGAPAALLESYRDVVASLLMSRSRDRHLQTLVVTSPGPGDGKSTLTSNLGILLCRVGLRVLLIDADPRRPKLHQIFGMVRSPGLIDLLGGSRTSEETIRETRVPGLYLMPSGDWSEAFSAQLYSAQLRHLLRNLRQEFDLVLIDTPPILAISDSRVLSNLSDGVIVVASAGETTREALLAVRQKLAEDGSHLLGLVLNRWDPAQAAYGTYYSSYWSQGTAPDERPA